MTPTSTPTAVCLNPVFFLSIWQASPQLGCPTLAFTSDVTYQFFEGGLLVWQKNPTPSTIHAVFNDGTWQQQTDPGGPAAPSCPEAAQEGDNAPIYGFGVTWCNTPVWQQKLGGPTTGEQAATNNQVQLFENGKIISVGQAGIYVLLDTGRWERFASDLGSPTPTPTPTPCSQPPASRWANSLYLVYADQLGCPLGGEVFTQAAFQQYQGGMMVWRDDLDVVYTLYNGGSYAVYDVSGAIDQEYGENLKGSFGWLWSNNGVVRGRLGDPNAPEEVANDFVAQDFENGTLLYFRENFSQNYVLLADLAEWVASN